MTKSELSRQNKRLQSENNELKNAIYKFVCNPKDVENIKTFVAVALEVDIIKQSFMPNEGVQIDGFSEMINNLFEQANNQKSE